MRKKIKAKPKEKDTIDYRANARIDKEMHEWLELAADKICATHGVVIRQLIKNAMEAK